MCFVGWCAREVYELIVYVVAAVFIIYQLNVSICVCEIQRSHPIYSESDLVRVMKNEIQPTTAKVRQGTEIKANNSK